MLPNPKKRKRSDEPESPDDLPERRETKAQHRLELSDRYTAFLHPPLNNSNRTSSFFLPMEDESSDSTSDTELDVRRELFISIAREKMGDVSASSSEAEAKEDEEAKDLEIISIMLANVLTFDDTEKPPSSPVESFGSSPDSLIAITGLITPTARRS